MKKMWKIIVAIALFASFGLNAANADVIELSDDNASVVIFANDGEDGMGGWEIDGTDHLAWQWFWIRLAGDDREFSIENRLDFLGASSVDTNGLFGDPADDNAVVAYGNDDLGVQVEYQLTGGAPGSGFSSIAELISLVNLSEQPLELTFFQYSDFDLNGNEFGDTVEILNGNTAVQSDGSTILSESVVTPAADGWEADFFSNTITKLEDGGTDNLNDDAGPAGPGDVTWAFQWNVTLAPFGTPGSDFLISKVKNIQTTVIPEPASFVLLGLGGLMLARRRRA